MYNISLKLNIINNFFSNLKATQITYYFFKIISFTYQFKLTLNVKDKEKM